MRGSPTEGEKGGRRKEVGGRDGEGKKSSGEREREVGGFEE